MTKQNDDASSSAISHQTNRETLVGEVDRLHEEIKMLHQWIHDLQTLTIDQTLEIEQLRAGVRPIRRPGQ